MFFSRYIRAHHSDSAASQAQVAKPAPVKPAPQVAKPAPQVAKPAPVKPAAVPIGKRLLTIDLDAPTEDQLRAVAKSAGAFWGRRGGGRPKRAATPIAAPVTGALPPDQTST